LSILAFLGYERKVVRNLFVTNPGLPRRVSYIWRIAPYTPDEMMDIIRREFSISGFVRISVPGVDAPEERSRQNCVDILDALYQRGAFSNVNGGAAAPIVEEYRSVFSLTAYATGRTPVERTALASRRNQFSWKTLEEALAVYARKTAGHDLLYFDNIPQKELPRHELDPDTDAEGGDDTDSGLRTPGVVRAVPAAASD
jgi:hypothetical protein